MQGKNIETEDVEKTGMLNDFSALVFNRKTSCGPCTKPSELEERDGEQNEAP